MNKGEMRVFTRILLGESKQDFYKDTEIDTVQNISALAIASTTMASLTFEDTPLVAGQQRYGFPTDSLAIVSVQVCDGATVGGEVPAGKRIWSLTPLAYDAFQNMNTVPHQGLPMYYRTEFGATSLVNTAPGDVWILPIPDATVRTLRVVHRQKPTKMQNDSDTCELAESAHETVCYRTAMIVSRKSKDRQLMSDMANMYAESLNTLKGVLHKQDSTGPFHIRNVY